MEMTKDELFGTKLMDGGFSDMAMCMIISYLG